MKQIKTILYGEDYEKVEKDFDRLPKWDFTAPGCNTLECVILDRKEMPSKFNSNDKFTMFFVKHRQTKIDYTIMPNAILRDFLKDIANYSAIKVNYLGMKQAAASARKYMNFECFRDKTFKFDPSIWTPANYEKKDSNEQVTQNTSTATQNVAASTAPADDDLPF